MGWEQVQRGVELPFDPRITIPQLHEIQLDVPSPDPVADVEATTRAAVVERLASAVTPGMTVAVGAGSRGLSKRVELTRGAIDGLRALGAEPFVVPAMGSHGGATAEGQLKMLNSLGITEESVGAEIRATMDNEIIATTASGMTVHLDHHALSADRILPVNRIKPHTCFKGPIESGCTKMAVVGFGKQPGAAQIHSCGPIEMRDRLLDGIAALKATGRLLGGVGSIESCSGDVVSVDALTADEVGGDREHELTEYARALVPALPFKEIDVLIIERGGKDISGTTLDPERHRPLLGAGPRRRRVTGRLRDRAARHHRHQRRQRAGHRVRRLHPGVGRQPDRLREDLHQLLHGRSGGDASFADADGAAR